MKTTMSMKRNQWYLIVLSIFLATLNGQANQSDNTQKKEINKSFSVSVGGKLVVDNRYGNVTVTYWSKNEVSLRVVVEANARTEGDAKEKLDQIDIQMQKSGNTVYAETSIKNLSNNGGNNRINIDYYINIPSKFAVDISQKYGSIYLPEKNMGRCTLSIKYGNIHAGSFTLPLSIEAGYSDINIDDVQDLRMDLSYCRNVEMKNGKNLNIDSKYSNLNIGNIEKLKLEKKYGNLTVQSVDKVLMAIKYSKMKIRYLKEELDIDGLNYSTLTVNELSSDFKRVRAESRYGTLNLSIPANTSFNVNATNMKYGELKVKDFNITRSNIENKVNYYYQINGGSSHRVVNFKGYNHSNLNIKTSS
ncbi:MAG: hypothetical protein LBH12_05690 [Dysgonamonadaceae bacterium]|jgi:hypothetical protein|nr:hypothetical protein [Dysgonamonadaceae bacterium]